MRNALFLATILLVASPDPGAADDLLLRLCANPGNAERAVGACGALLREGRLNTGEAARVSTNLGSAYLALDRAEQAERAYDEALAADPAIVDAWAGRARARERLGKLPQAAVDWNRALALAPREPDFLVGRGAFRLRSGNPAGALADFDEAQRRSPRDMAITFNRGLALAELGRDAEAERMFSAVIAATPDDASAWLNRARLRVSRDRDAALADFDEAVARAGVWPTPYVERGALLRAMGRAEAANEDFRRAWELGLRSEFLNARMLEMGG